MRDFKNNIQIVITIKKNEFKILLKLQKIIS